MPLTRARRSCGLEVAVAEGDDDGDAAGWDAAVANADDSTCKVAPFVPDVHPAHSTKATSAGSAAKFLGLPTTRC